MFLERLVKLIKYYYSVDYPIKLNKIRKFRDVTPLLKGYKSTKTFFCSVYKRTDLVYMYKQTS